MEKGPKPSHVEEMLSIDEVFLKRIHKALDENLDNAEFSVEDLGKEIGMSRSQIHRRLQQLKGQSASRFIRSYKLKRAKEFLKKNIGNVSQVADWVGFSSPAYFGKVYLEEFGYPPSEEPKISAAVVAEEEKVSVIVIEESESEVTDNPVLLQRSRLFLVIISLALFIILGWWYWSEYLEKTNLTKSLNNARLAILPYENKTNNPDLDILGDMAADWIIEGLINFESLDLVSYQYTPDKTAYASVANWKTFAEETGTEKIMTGSFYLQDSLLIFQGHVIDVETGNIDFVLPEIKGNRDNPEPIVNELRQRIMGLVAIGNDREEFHTPFYQSNPPKFEAYQSFKKAASCYPLEVLCMRKQAEEAIRLDKQFFWGYVYYIWSYANSFTLDYVRADSAFRLIDKNFDRLTPYQSLWYDYLEQIIHGSPPLRLSSLEKIYERNPNNYIISKEMGTQLARNNKVHEAVEILEKITRLPNRFENRADVQPFGDHGLYLFFLNRPKEMVEIMDMVPKKQGLRKWWYPLYKATYHIFYEEHDSVNSIAVKMGKDDFQLNQIYYFHYWVSYHYALKGDKERQVIWANKGMMVLRKWEKFSDVSQIDIANQYFLAGQYEEALPIYREWATKDQKGNFEWWSKVGVIYANLGDMEKAENVITELLSTDKPTKNGSYKYAIARIYAALDEKALATEYLKQAFIEGFYFRIRRYYHDPLLRPLHGYPDYDTFVKFRIFSEVPIS